MSIDTAAKWVHENSFSFGQSIKAWLVVLVLGAGFWGVNAIRADGIARETMVSCEVASQEIDVKGARVNLKVNCPWGPMDQSYSESTAFGLIKAPPKELLCYHKMFPAGSYEGCKLPE